MNLSPALADLIRALTEEAAERGYLTPEAAPVQAAATARTERVPLPQDRHAA